MNYVPYSAQEAKEDLTPEKRKEVEAERMYQEYKEQCTWGGEPKTLGKLNPYELNFDFIQSIPEDEWKELIKLYKKKRWLVELIWYVIGIFMLIEFYYYIRGFFQE